MQAHATAERGFGIERSLKEVEHLIPVCSMHHTKIHNNGWIIELGPNRELTLRLPDGTIHTTGPTSRRTAA